MQLLKLMARSMVKKGNDSILNVNIINVTILGEFNLHFSLYLLVRHLVFPLLTLSLGVVSVTCGCLFHGR